jgi:beta-lactamase class A
MLSRRDLVIASAALPFAAHAAPADPFAALDAKHGGQLGVAALDTGSGRRLAHRANQRFLMCSTFKLLLVALVLHRIDRGREQLGRRVAYDAMLFPPGQFYAPVTRAHLHEGGMSVDALCAAAIEWSDNGAANLLMESAGGPAAVTGYTRRLGDPVTRLDRVEPALNTFTPGDIRDTTTPAAMLADMQAVLLGEALSKASRARLTDWLVKSQTGKARLRAGLPARWKVGDKTGTGFRSETNDIAIVWPPGRAPILIAAYYAGSRLYPESLEAVLAEAGRVVAKAFAR